MSMWANIAVNCQKWLCRDVDYIGLRPSPTHTSRVSPRGQPSVRGIPRTGDGRRGHVDGLAGSNLLTQTLKTALEMLTASEERTIGSPGEGKQGSHTCGRDMLLTLAAPLSKEGK